MASGSFPVQADPTDPEAELEGSSTPRPAVGADAASLVARYVQVRDFTRQLAAPLSAEDCVVQSMPDASPTKWHLAHVTWFFETFVLKPQAQRGFDYRVFDPDFEYLFNSYYNSVGAQYPRGQRGLITRPDLATVLAYREHVDQALARLIEGEPVGQAVELAGLIELGLQHEQQHQELLLMDIKHALFQSPKLSAYAAQREPSGVALRSAAPSAAPSAALAYIDFGGGLASVGHDRRGFCFDNERPRHQVHLADFRLANRLVTNAEYLEFVAAGGYSEPLHWLSDGWARVQSAGWRAPSYWLQRDGAWFEYTLGGLVALDPAAPVCHVSYFEAEAFASWAGARLPTEFEWERAAEVSAQRGQADVAAGNFVESGRLHPGAAPLAAGPQQLFGDCWEWTSSSYAPYPGFRAAPGALGEYNGKFMVSQQVLRGGACVTSASHFRSSYRNFFYPHQRWMFSGIRLAR